MSRTTTVRIRHIKLFPLLRNDHSPFFKTRISRHRQESLEFSKATRAHQILLVISVKLTRPIFVSTTGTRIVLDVWRNHRDDDGTRTHVGIAPCGFADRRLRRSAHVIIQFSNTEAPGLVDAIRLKVPFQTLACIYHKETLSLIAPRLRMFPTNMAETTSSPTSFCSSCKTTIHDSEESLFTNISRLARPVAFLPEVFVAR